MIHEGRLLIRVGRRNARSTSPIPTTNNGGSISNNWEEFGGVSTQFSCHAVPTPGTQEQAVWLLRVWAGWVRVTGPEEKVWVQSPASAHSFANWNNLPNISMAQVFIYRVISFNSVLPSHEDLMNQEMQRTWLCARCTTNTQHVFDGPRLLLGCVTSGPCYRAPKSAIRTPPSLTLCKGGMRSLALSFTSWGQKRRPLLTLGWWAQRKHHYLYSSSACCGGNRPARSPAETLPLIKCL